MTRRHRRTPADAPGGCCCFGLVPWSEACQNCRDKAWAHGQRSRIIHVCTAPSAAGLDYEARLLQMPPAERTRASAAGRRAARALEQ